MSQPSAGDAPRSRVIVIVQGEPDAPARVSEALGEAGVTIESIDDRLIAELGVITLGTDDDDAALHALLEAGLRAVTTQAIVLRLPDRPGALARVAELLGRNRLNVRTIHIVHRQAGRAIAAVSTDDDDAARSLLAAGSLL